MIKNLRRRPRPDQLKNQQRRTTNATGRLVYLGLLGALAIAFADYLFGDLVMLRADGLIVRDEISIATTYIATVKSVEVEPGQEVAVNEALAVVQSSDILEQLADLSARRARLAAEATDFKIRAETVTKLLPLAERRENETSRLLLTFDELSDRQLITNARYDEALRASFDARQSLVRLRAESETLADELATLDRARADAESALEDLRRYYDNGLIKSPVAGTIGAIVPATGGVHRPGEKLMSVYTGEAHVLTYLPRNYLFAIRPGMEVAVSAGRQSATGVIAEILPVADALPRSSRTHSVHATEASLRAFG